VAGDNPVRGYLVFGGWYKTWLEHMLEHERRRMSLKGLSETETNKRMKKYATFYELYLNHQRSPAEITREHPALTEIWYDEPERQYGRPARYDHKVLVGALNATRPGSAEFVEWPRVDHVLMVHASLQKAFGKDPEQRYDPKLTDYVLNWLKKH
jgi:hypothetical protein